MTTNVLLSSNYYRNELSRKVASFEFNDTGDEMYSIRGDLIEVFKIFKDIDAELFLLKSDLIYVVKSWS